MPHSQRMRFRGLVAIGVAAMLGGLAAEAPAQPREHPHGKHGKPHDKHGGKHYDKRHGKPGHPHGGPPGHRYGHPGGRGAGPAHDWYRGGHVPPMYRSRHYVVSDWRHHHLAPPPRGYQWVQYGGDYVMIAVGSGLIAQIVLSN